jgi:hypothetical protein
MGAMYHDYKFKSQKYQEFWEDELQNTIQNIKEPLADSTKQQS